VLRQSVSGIVLFFLSASVASAATYYVRTDGNNGNTGTANTAAGAWLTINYAAGHVSAGDVVRVQAGTYVETASPSVSGTAGNTVTLVADGTVTTCGMSFNSKSYIRVIGFTMNPNASTCGGNPQPIVHLGGTNTGLEFWNNNIGNLSTSAGGIGTTITSDRCTKCIILGGSVHDLGNPGTANGITLVGDDNYVGYVALSNICYIGVNPSGSRLRFINLDFSGFLQCGGSHPDFYFINVESPGYARSLVESNFGIGTPNAGDNKYFHAANSNAGGAGAWTNDVWRQDVSYNMGSAFFSMYALSGGSTLTNWAFYNNTNTYGEQDSTNTTSAACGNMQNQGGGAITYSVFNSIFYQCWGNSAKTGIAPWQTTNPVAANYNLIFSPLNSITVTSNWTAQTHQQTNVDPLFNNFASQDYTLRSPSTARGFGGPITTATSCSGTTLNVATNTGGLFIGDNSANLAAYSGKLVPGDFLTIDSQTYQVASVSGDALTLNASLTCTAGDAVYFGNGSTIDIGAYPYKAGGYSLVAGYSISGGTATITPNDPSLVRFVVCYSDSVPYAVSNSAPYTCAAPAGTFSARVYPRYASQTQSVAAVFGNGPPAAPTGVKIIR
jgi:hypothetical protein